MNKKLCLSLTAAVLLLAAALPAQIRYGGYLSCEYIQGQSASDYPHGSFENIMGGVQAAGVIQTKFGFSLEVRSRSESLFQIEQAWVGYIPSDALTVKVGMYLVPFGVYNQNSRPQESPLIRTPLNLQYMYPQSWRDLGICVEGKASIFSYAVYVGNGLKEADNLESGQQFSDNNKSKTAGGRLALSLSSSFQVGGSYCRGKYDDLNERNLTMEGLDISWLTDQCEVRAEITKALLKNPETYATGKSQGFFVWLVMKFKNFQPVGSYQKVKYNDAYHGDGIALNQGRWTLGARCILTQNVYLKAEYDWNRETPKIKNNVLQVQAAVAF